MTSATAETPTWMVCLGFAIPLRVVGPVKTRRFLDETLDREVEGM
jgi:hypothetical protein